MLIGGIVAVVVVAVGAVAFLTRRVAHDDVHSVEGYHRSLHTLESINAHPTVSGGEEVSVQGAKSAYPESAVRVASPSTVRLTGLRGSVPPVPTPPLADPDAPMTFDDAAPSPPPPPPPPPAHRDKAMTSINHRPRRLAAPAMAVAVVLVLVVVLLLAGSHKVPPSRTHSSNKNSGHSGHNGPTGSTPPTTPPKKRTTSTTSTPPPTAVSAPLAATPQSATYDVADSTFTVTLAATSGSCWVDATSSATGATLFSGTLAAGGQHSFSATGPVTVIVGAPTVITTTVDGGAVVFPAGFQTPFAMSFVPPAAASG
jgi:Domain of unknown function (DUF4115)